MSIRTRILLALASISMLGSLFVAAPALAQTTAAAGASGSAQAGAWSGHGGGGHMTGKMPGVFGTVSAISGTTLTVQSKGFGQNATASTYTVDASNATVMKGSATSAVSAIAIGDMVMVQGTVSGTSVTATSIRDGIPQGMGKGQGGMMASSTRSRAPMAQIQGNGEPVVGGTVSSVSGNTLSLSTKAGTSYSVDATNATVLKGNATSSISAVATGDQVIVQGTVNGTSVVASSVIDQGAAPSSSASGKPQGGMGGVFGAIGGFFQHLFGFF